MTMTRTMRYPLFAALILLTAACGTDTGPPAAEPTETVLTDSGIAALPVLTPTDGTLLCTAIGDGSCPLHSAVANRLDADRIAVWEPGSPVLVWRAGDTVGTRVGRFDESLRPYRMAVAVRAHRDGYQLITADTLWRRIQVDAEGSVTGSTELTIDQPMVVVGYVGNQAVRQAMTGWTSPEGGALTLSLLRDATDTSGTELLQAPVPWLLGGTSTLPPLPPYIAPTPSWALNPGSGLAWAEASEFMVEFRTLDGAVRWRLRGPAAPEVTEAELAIRDSVVREASRLLPLEEGDYASMRDRSPDRHSAVSGLTITPSDEVIVALSALPSRDSIDYLRVGADGVPTGRFTLERRSRILLAEGDSMLVHRPTEGEPWEVRWVTFNERR